MHGMIRLWVVCAAAILVATAALPGSRTAAQDGTQATVSALQTEVAALETMVALQTEVANLREQLTPDAGGSVEGAPGAEQILYEADWSAGAAGWTALGGWKVAAGMLLNDGSTDAWQWIEAPYQLDISDYAVEAEIQTTSDCHFSGYGIVVRADQDRGYWIGPMCSGSFSGYKRIGVVADGAWQTFGSDDVAGSEWEPDAEWRHYRVEVRANAITVSMDGVRLIEATDNRYLSGNVGLWSSGMQIAIRSFKILAL